MSTEGSHVEPLSKAQVCQLQQCFLCSRFQHEFTSSNWHQRTCQQIGLVLKWIGFAFCAIVALHVSSLPLRLLLCRTYFTFLGPLYIIRKRRFFCSVWVHSACSHWGSWLYCSRGWLPLYGGRSNFLFYLKMKLFSYCIAPGTWMTEPIFGTGAVGTVNIL